jgi:hypothetical protein
LTRFNKSLTVNEEIKSHVKAAEMLNLPRVAKCLTAALKMGTPNNKRFYLKFAQAMLKGDSLGQELVTSIEKTRLKLAVTERG